MQKYNQKIIAFGGRTGTYTWWSGLKIIVKKIADYDKNTNLLRHDSLKLAETILSL